MPADKLWLWICRCVDIFRKFTIYQVRKYVMKIQKTWRFANHFQQLNIAF